MEKGEQFNFITLQDIVLTINQKYKSKVKEHFKSLPLQEQVVTAGLVMFFSYTKSNQKATIASLLPIVNREMLQKTSNKISLPELERSLETLSFYGIVEVQQLKKDYKNAIVSVLVELEDLEREVDRHFGE